jgi:Flp pilus assembly protein TadD
MTTTPVDVAAHRLHTGPDPHSIEDCLSFFGRNDESRSVAELWVNERATILCGGAGVGKTSLLQNGVVRFLLRRGTDNLLVGDLTRRSPFSAAPLFEHNPFTLALLSSWAPMENSATLSTMTVSSFLRWRERTLGMSTSLAAIDQTEEIFRGSGGMERHRKRFLAELAEALDDHPHLHILVVIRDSYLPALFSDNTLASPFQVRLQGLKPVAAMQEVERSLVGAEPLVPPGIAEQLAHQLIDEILSVQLVEANSGQVALRDDRVHPAYLQAVTAQFLAGLASGVLAAKNMDLRRANDVDLWLTQFVCRGVLGVARYYERDPVQLCLWLARNFVSVEGQEAAVNENHGVSAGVPAAVLLSLEDHYILRSEIRSDSRWFELQSPRIIRPLQFAAQTILSFTRTANAPDFSDYLKDAMSAFSRAEFQRAARSARRALQVSFDVDPSDQARAETLLGNVSYQNGDAEQARYHYMNSAKLFEAAQYQLAVGRLLAAIGRLYLIELDATTAATTLLSALNRAPDDTVRLELARAFAASGEGHAAAALLESVLRSKDDRDVGEAHLLRSEIRADLGDAAGALADLERVARPGAPSVRATRALTMAGLGRFADADREIERALDMASDSGQVLLRAAQVQALRGDFRRAAQFAQRAISAKGTPLTQYQRQQAEKLQGNRPTKGLATR